MASCACNGVGWDTGYQPNTRRSNNVYVYQAQCATKHVDVLVMPRKKGGLAI